MDETRLPLSGVRVLEMGRLIAAPFCAQILGDLGADVIKLERVGRGDDIRSYGPPFLLDEASRASASPFYLTFNRNKRSVAVDFSRPEGAELVRRLAAHSDVFIENYKVGSLEKYGLNEASIRSVCQEIVYLSVSGFGQSGPYAHRPATDILVQGMSGLMSMTGQVDGPPTKVGVSIADMVTGLYGAVAVISSMYNLAKTHSPGAWAGVSLLDSCMSIMGSPAISSYLTGVPQLRTGDGAGVNSPAGVFYCCDGELLIQAGNDADFVKLCRLLGLESLSSDLRFLTRASRVTHDYDLRKILSEAIRKWRRADLYAALVSGGIMCAPINTIEQALADPQVLASGTLVAACHPDDPGLELIGSPIRFSDGAPEVRRHPPRLGEHTADVLEELLGLGSREIAELADRGVVEVHGYRSHEEVSS